MSESGGIIHVKGTDGVVKEVTLYTDVSDVTDVYKEFGYLGQTVYACTTTDPTDPLATEFRYRDTDGVVRYLCERKRTQKDGGVAIYGDLDCDLVVDGDLIVHGNISGNAVASGSITYDSLSGSTKPWKTLDSCDISVRGWSSYNLLIFTGGVTRNSDGALYTTRMVETTDTIVTIYCDLVVQHPAADYAIFNRAFSFTVANGATVTVNCDRECPYGIYNNIFVEDGGLNISGSVIVNDAECGVYGDQIVVDNGGVLNVVYAVVSDPHLDSLSGIYGTLTVNSGGVVSIALTCSQHDEAYGVRGVHNVAAGGTLDIDIFCTSNIPSTAVGISPKEVTDVITLNGTTNVSISGEMNSTAIGIDGTIDVAGKVTVNVSPLGVSWHSALENYGIRLSSSTGASIHSGGAIEILAGNGGTSYGVYVADSENLVVQDGCSLFVSGQSDVERPTYAAYLAHGDLSVLGTATLYGDKYGVFADDHSVLIIESTGALTAEGSQYAVYNEGTYTVESGAKVTYNGSTYGI